MPAIYITCPTTNKPVKTGFSAGSKESFESNKYIGNSVTCQHCGQQHVWDKKDAYLEGDEDWPEVISG